MLSLSLSLNIDTSTYIFYGHITSYFYYLLKESPGILALAGILSKYQSLIPPSTECREKPHHLYDKAT